MVNTRIFKEKITSSQIQSVCLVIPHQLPLHNFLIILILQRYIKAKNSKIWIMHSASPITITHIELLSSISYKILSKVCTKFLKFLSYKDSIVL